MAFYRVYYEDTDAGGVMYHASHVRFAERARTEWLRERGLEQGALRAEHGIIFAVRSLAVDYVAPAKLDDLLDVSVEVKKIGGTSMEMEQSIKRDGKLLAGIVVRSVAINEAGKPVRIPDWLREKMENPSPFLGGG